MEKLYSELEDLLARRRALESKEVEFTLVVEDEYRAIDARIEEVSGLLDEAYWERCDDAI